ncbi:MAG: right-handed parallel beta-helix repeat-containing protein [Sumerlaeia bacterium]
MGATAAPAALFTVTSDADAGAGTLREAIALANSNAGPDMIEFDGSVTQIVLESALQVINEQLRIDGSVNASHVLVDGDTFDIGSPIFDFNSSADNSELYGMDLLGSSSSGLSMTGDNNIIGAPGKGNIIRNAGVRGLSISGGTGTIIQSNIFGLESDGSTVDGNFNALAIFGGSNFTIGGADPSERNVFASSTNSSQGHGILLSGGSDILIEGNYIGTDATGLLDRGNAVSGVSISGAVTSVTLRGNVISGNAENGLVSAGDNVQVVGNIIGLGADGSTVIANGAEGIDSNSLANGLVIGGPSAADRNVVSGNAGTGVRVDSPSATVQGNFIGTDATGTLARPNSPYGLYIGGTNVLLRDNLISGNAGDGVALAGSGAQIHGNWFGLASDGTTMLANGSDGIDLVSFVTSATIGTGAPADRNVFGANGGHGIENDADNVVVQGNYIGTDITGLVDATAGTRGIRSSGDNVTIRDNVVGGFSLLGIEVTGNSSQIHGNLIGLGADGSTVLANGFYGILVAASASGTIIGSASAADRNVISGNNQHGLLNQGPSTVISGNFIGTDITGNLDRGNGLAGVRVNSTATTSTITGNAIAANGGAGVEIDSSPGAIASNNVFGSNEATTATLPNGGSALAVSGSTSVSLNTFVHSTEDHILIDSGAAGVAIGQNVFSANCRFPISFAGALVANDALDVDTGPNNQQNHPAIDPADDAAVVLSGTLVSTASTTHTIYLYSSAAAHSSGNGPGEGFLGSTTAITDPAGDATWSVSAGPVAAGRVLSAYAVAENGDSSHFSPAVAVQVFTAIKDWSHLE